MLEPGGHEPLTLGQRALDCTGDRRGVVGIRAHGCISARLVERRVRRRDNGNTAGHRLDHRNPESLEAGGVDNNGSTAVEPRQLLVRNVPEPPNSRVVEQRLLAPALCTDDCEEKVTFEQAVGFDERL